MAKSESTPGTDKDKLAENARANAQADKRKPNLTQISKALQSQSTSDGFAKAKLDANRALANNQIILNNRFVLQSTIGAGGMGTVYKAQDLRRVEASDTNPYVATKVLSGDFKKHPDAFIALQREASRSSQLAHPNIVTVHDFDRDGDTVYMTMELLEGEDLEKVIARHRKTGLPKLDALKIFADICRALSHAHKKGIIHCDLKPANIFITKEGAKVLDFGIARLALKTQDHFDAGKIGALTPDYASLEMFNYENPDQSDDVFAAAIICYELLSGKHPYQNKSAPAALSLNIQPAPIEGLSKSQWKALSQALQLKKEDRTKSIKAFAEAMTRKVQFPVFKLVSAISLLAVAAFSYVQFFTENELKSVVRETLKTAKGCIQINDYECTISSANAILKIQADHQQALALLNEAELAKEKQQLNSTILMLITDAQACLDQKNFVCAADKAREVLDILPDDTKAIEILSLVDKNEQSYQVYVKQATDCFNANDYRCAIREAERAMALKPDAAQAMSIKQNAEYAEKQAFSAREQALVKAKSIVKDGQLCFNKYDYSCAIAKSESALEFVPSYQPALKLKKAAQKAIADAKKAIQIE